MPQAPDQIDAGHERQTMSDVPTVCSDIPTTEDKSDEAHPAPIKLLQCVPSPASTAMYGNMPGQRHAESHKMHKIAQDVLSKRFGREPDVAGSQAQDQTTRCRGCSGTL